MYYQIGIENRWFETARKNPFEAVYYSDFETFVERVSVLNGRL